jgi:hypothetical protein
VTALPNYTPVPVLTVPSTATKPYLLRQVFVYTGLAANQYTSCNLHADVAGPPVVPLFSGVMADLNVPFRPGETVTLQCPGGAGPYWTFVFS